MSEIVVKIQGMTCGHCAGVVERGMRAIEGVEGCTVHLPTGTARVKVSQGATPRDAELKAVVEDAGFGVVAIEASR